jgi:hypothetical protein
VAINSVGIDSYIYLLAVMGDYKIKTEDKAPFINLLKAKGVDVGSYEIVDDKAKPYFEFKTEDPRTEDIVKGILKTNKKINQIKEMGKLTRSQLAEIIREELANAKKEKLNEMDVTPFIPLIGPLAGVIAGWLAIKANKDYVKKQLGPDATDEEVKAAAAKALVDKMQKDYGGSSR